MSIAALENEQTVASAHLETVQKKFLNESVFLGISRQDIQYIAAEIGAGFIALGSLYDFRDTRIANLHAESAEPAIDSGLPLQAIAGCIGGFFSFGIAGAITRHSQNDAYNTIKDRLTEITAALQKKRATNEEKLTKKIRYRTFRHKQTRFK